MAKKSDFDASVPLPPSLEVGAIRRAIDYMEKELAGLVEIYYEQANVFSAIVGIFGTKALDSVSNYEKHKHTDTAQQRFPDLCRRGSGKGRPAQDCLESKGSKRPWAIQSHYDHAGWYIVWRYLVDPTKIIKPDRIVVIWRVDVAFLQQQDWKYEGSKAEEGRGGRTHTFGVKHPADRFRESIIYSHPRIVLRQSRPALANG